MNNYNFRYMKRSLLFLVLIGTLPLSMAAQDDLYFTPKKSDKKISSSYEKIEPEQVYYSGSDRDVDEYNRHGVSSYFQKIGTDSLGNDVIEFHGSNGDVSDTLHIYPGTSINYNVDEDYSYSRHMSRYDDYYWSDPWLYGYYGYSPYWHARWGWYNPWYAGWYDPWYYGYGFGWTGWGYPYYHNHWNWGWSRPVYAYRGHTGTRNHGSVTRPVNTRNGNFSSSRGNSNRNDYTNNGNFNRRNNTINRNQGTTFNNNSRPSYGGGSFGGSRGGGSFGGGSRGGGGGHFGGRR